MAGETIEAVVGVMRAMEGSGVFDILDPVSGQKAAEGDTVPKPPSGLALGDPSGPSSDDTIAAEGVLTPFGGGNQIISPVVEHAEDIEGGDGGDGMGEGTGVQREREGIGGGGTEVEEPALAQGEEGAGTEGGDVEGVDNEGVGLILVPGGRDAELYAGGGGVHEYRACVGGSRAGGVGEGGSETPID